MEGRNCPRKVLINNHPQIIKPQNPDALINANTPEDAARVKAIFLKRS
jgi:molybdenum cofactor guanylyltransferase